jgi:hypothetical protein
MALARVSRVSIPCGLRPLKKLHGSEIFSTRSRLASEHTLRPLAAKKTSWFRNLQHSLASRERAYPAASGR